MAEEKPWPLGKYELTERSYIPTAPGKPDALLEAGAQITYAGKPGPHMLPLDAAARAAQSRCEAEERRRNEFGW